MKALKKAKAWLKQLKEDMARESVSLMKGEPAHCCSRPIEPMSRQRRQLG